MAFNMTLDQEEIEKAIDIHVRSLVPGLSTETKIGISLSATRGPRGFTAEIDLNPTVTAIPTPAAPQPEAVAEEVVVPSTTTKIDGRTKAAKALNIPKANEVPAASATEEGNAASSVAVEESTEDTVTADEEEAARAADAMDVNEPIPAQEEAEQPAEVTEAAPRASLFSGLNKPKN